ncbi:MAG: helix-turn-helix domain-containing protein [Clostridium sp.]|nr:helix-turn-helix domain-containing protein [Clostridium sp.]MCM1207797.1 helix-turn-helix domain-containing protein [Ruminococcus sp.]
MTIGERVKYIRTETVGLTLEKFGEKLGAKKNTVSQWENDKNTISDTVIKLICREFNISEKWLRYEEGDICSVNQSRKQAMEDFTKKIAIEPESFKTRLVEGLAKLSDEDWKDVERVFDKLMSDKNVDAAESTENFDVVQYLNENGQQIYADEKQRESASGGKSEVS